MLNFCDFIQVYVLTTNHHLKPIVVDKEYFPNKMGNNIFRVKCPK